MLQIEEHKNKSAKNLSGGTLRKVSVANYLQPITFSQSPSANQLCGIATLQIN